MNGKIFSLLTVFTLLCLVLTSCKDKPEVPPVVEDIITTYSAERLQVEVGGVPAAANACVELVQLSDKHLTTKLINMLSGWREIGRNSGNYI